MVLFNFLSHMQGTPCTRVEEETYHSPLGGHGWGVGRERVREVEERAVDVSSSHDSPNILSGREEGRREVEGRGEEEEREGGGKKRRGREGGRRGEGGRGEEEEREGGGKKRSGREKGRREVEGRREEEKWKGGGKKRRGREEGKSPALWTLTPVDLGLVVSAM